MSSFGHFIARKYLSRANASHVHDYPQIACFSFDLITLFIHLDGQYERDELKFLERKIFPRIAPGATCLDVGANIGNHALHFARSFEQVIAFEPHPRVFRLLAFNAELAENVTALNIGASDAEGWVSIEDDKLNMAASSIGRAGGAGGKTVDFDLHRIDDLPEVQGCERISFMKFDVEGHERQALEGARETIRKHAPLIVLEVLPDEIEDGEAPSVGYLRSLGYQHFYELRSGGLLGRLPRKLYKAGRALSALVTGKRPSKAEVLVPVGQLEKRSYLMLLCAMEPLPEAEI